MSNFRHGHAPQGGPTPEYRTWINIKKRCLDEGSPHYSRYGAKGIGVCERWQKSFPDFLADMGTRPKGRYSIDRINPRGDYSPENCRWATDYEQSQNRKNSLHFPLNGVPTALSNVARAEKIPYRSLYRYVVQLGTSLEEAIHLTKMRKRLP